MDRWIEQIIHSFIHLSTVKPCAGCWRPRVTKSHEVFIFKEWPGWKTDCELSPETGVHSPKLTQRVLKALPTSEVGSDVEVPAAELLVGLSGRARERLSRPDSSMWRGLEACDRRGSGLQGQERSPAWPEWEVHERVSGERRGWVAGRLRGAGLMAKARRGFLLRAVGALRV